MRHKHPSCDSGDNGSVSWLCGWWLIQDRLQVRSNLQRALGRPVALDEASGMTIAAIKALEGDSADAPAAATEEAAAPAEPAPGAKKAAPIIQPAKIIDLDRDMPVKLSVRPGVVKASAAAPAKTHASCMGSASSLNATPERGVQLPPNPGQYPTQELPLALEKHWVFPARPGGGFAGSDSIFVLVQSSMISKSKYAGDSAASLAALASRTPSQPSSRSISPDLSPKLVKADQGLSAFSSAKAKPPTVATAKRAAGGTEAVPQDLENSFNWDESTRRYSICIGTLSHRVHRTQLLSCPESQALAFPWPSIMRLTPMLCVVQPSWCTPWRRSASRQAPPWRPSTASWRRCRSSRCCTWWPASPWLPPPLSSRP